MDNAIPNGVNNNLKSNRNMGIELLRILSMLMICMLHTLGQGGVLKSIMPLSKRYFFSWSLEILCFCAVNCYGFISGYVGLKSKSYFSKFFTIWLQTVFYSVIITIVFSIIMPDTVKPETWKSAFMPIMNSSYWYISAYFGLIAFMPLLNSAICNIDKQILKRSIITIVVILCTIPFLMNVDPFSLKDGYSMVWLAVLYIIGGYVKKYGVEQNFSKKKSASFFILSVAVTCAAKFITAYFIVKFGYEFKYNLTLVSYISPTIILSGIFLSLLLIKTEIKNTLLIKLISILGSASLGVYIIHVNPLVWNNYIKDFASGFANDNSLLFILKVIIAPVLIFLICALIDILRIQLFKLLQIKKFSGLIDSKLNKLFLPEEK